MSGNVATASLGTASHQFVKLANGNWQATGGGAYEKLVQTNQRAAYEYKCFYNTSQPYAMSRGWDISSVSFDVTDASGNDQHFANWTNSYTGQGPHPCAQARGFRLTTWTFANGVVDTVTYGNAVDEYGDGGPGIGLESLVSVANSLGRQINFHIPDSISGGVLFDNNLSGTDARSVSVNGWIGGTSVAFSDPMGKVTTVVLANGVTQSWTQNSIPYARPSQIFTPDHPTLPAIEYDYDTLGRIDQIRDAINLDNLPAHKNQVAEDAIKAKGAWLLYLPPYSPDLNPIEMAFSKLKAHLRAKNARTIDELWRAIGDICDLHKPAECANFFKAAGYGYT